MRRAALALSAKAPALSSQEHVISQVPSDMMRETGQPWARSRASIRGFGSLPDDIREQASWGRLLSDPEWASPLPPRGTSRNIPFIDVTDSYEPSAA